MAGIDPEYEREVETILAGSPPAPSVPAQTIARAKDRLPPLLIGVWQTYGFASLAKGRLRLIDPKWLAPLISYIFEGDVDLDGDCHAIALGDLGEVVIWSQRHGYGFLSPAVSSLDMRYILDPDPPSADDQILNELLHFPAEGIEAFDPDQQPLHQRLRQRLGPLPPGMIYGTTPVPPALEGTPLEHWVVAEAADWLEAVYTEMAITLVDWSRPNPDLRQVRGPWSQGGLMAAPRRLLP